MVLELTNKKSKPRDNQTETEASFLPKVFLRTFSGSKEVPGILETKINKNNMTLKLMKPASPDSPFIDADWVDFQYKCKRGESPIVSFNLSSEHSYDFLLQTERKFHDAANQIFRRKHDQFDDYKTLEEVGLDAPEKVEVVIAYKTPIAFWRGLPKEFIDNIKEFRFSGKFYGISWPKEVMAGTQNPIIKKKELDARVLDNVPHDQRDAEFVRLKDILIGTRFVNYQFTKGKGYGQEEHKFLVEPEQINYEKMQILEEIARTEPEGLKAQQRYHDNEARVLVQGNVDRDILGKVPKDFENYLGFNIYSIKGGNITIHYNGHQYTDKVYISLENTNLEQVERFVQLGVGGATVIVQSKQNKIASKSSTLFFNDGKACVNQGFF